MCKYLCHPRGCKMGVEYSFISLIVWVEKENYEGFHLLRFRDKTPKTSDCAITGGLRPGQWQTYPGEGSSVAHCGRTQRLGR
jgi:hypothetical protein